MTSINEIAFSDKLEAIFGLMRGTLPGKTSNTEYNLRINISVSAVIIVGSIWNFRAKLIRFR